MSKNLTFLLLPLLLFSYCTQERSDIRVVCEFIPSGFYKIKWETFPPMEGKVKIYESSVPDSFNLSSPTAEVEINKGFKDVFIVRPSQRSYFKLVFNKKYSIITAERKIPMQRLSNFRDFGGYINSDGKQVQWGKIYRSASLAYVTLQDAKVLKNLGIQTVIDFQSDRDRIKAPSRYPSPQNFNFPLLGSPPNIYFSTILAKEVKAEEVKKYAQDIFSFLLGDNSEYFIKMFNVLLDRDNYPVLFYCADGSSRTSVASALILAALDINIDDIINDYMLTNEQIDFSSLIPSEDNIFMQDQEIQETFTALFRAHRGTITYSFDKIVKGYGSLDNYFTTILNLTPEKRGKLKEILLY